MLIAACAKFVDDLVTSAQHGGMEAARHLRSKVCEYVTKELDLPSHIQIRVRIYANTRGLALVYCCNKILDSMDDLAVFIRGFNMGHPMCDFVDAGDGKECADSKLKGDAKVYCIQKSPSRRKRYLTDISVLFDHDMADVQCQAIMFGGSADSGYARLLLPYVGDNSKSKRIILVEGPPFAKELAVLKDEFLVTRFPDVFRNTKLPFRRVSFSITPPPTPISRAPSYAATISSPVDAAAITADEDHHPSTTITVPIRREYPVLQNSRGQRIDEPINPLQTLLYAQKNKKLCNAYHIMGECPYTECTFVHGNALDEKGLEARRWIARLTPCRSGLLCRDGKCFLGHQCPDKACQRTGKNCRFPKELHNVVML